MPKELRNYKNLEDLRNKIIKDWFGNPLIDIVTKFGLVTSVMQNPDTLFLVGREYVRVRARQGYKYCEGTIAPQYHTRGDKRSKATLTESEAVNHLIEGIKAGEKEYPYFEGNVLATLGRELINEKGEEEVLRVLREMSGCDPAYVVGFGLVCDEAAFPPHLYVNVLRKARKLGIRVDPWCPHAGEWANKLGEEPNSDEVRARLLDNLRVAVYQMDARRVEHARTLYEDSELSRFMAERNIGITSCPGSYLSSGLIKDARELHLNRVQARGVKVSLGPDDDLFQDSMPLVWDQCQRSYFFTEEDELRFRVDAWKIRLGNRKPVPADIAHLI